MTDSELCFLTRDDLTALREEYPELNARLKRFANVGNQVRDATRSPHPPVSPSCTHPYKKRKRREGARSAAAAAEAGGHHSAGGSLPVPASRCH